MRFVHDNATQTAQSVPRLKWPLIGALAFGLFTDFLLLTIVVPILATLLHADSTPRLTVTAIGVLFSAKAGTQVFVFGSCSLLLRLIPAPARHPGRRNLC